jgi:hypothetical protein
MLFHQFTQHSSFSLPSSTIFLVYFYDDMLLHNVVLNLVFNYFMVSFVYPNCKLSVLCVCAFNKLSNTDPTKTWGWTHMLGKSKQLLLLIRHPSCYSYIQPVSKFIICLIHVICVCLRIVVSNTYCVLILYNCLLFPSICVHPQVLVGSVLLNLLVFLFVLLCVFTFWVPCCDVRYDICIKMMFSSSLPPQHTKLKSNTDQDLH